MKRNICQFILGFTLGNYILAMISVSLSPRHDASSDCG